MSVRGILVVCGSLGLLKSMYHVESGKQLITFDLLSVSRSLGTLT